MSAEGWADAWHTECTQCGIALTVKTEDAMGSPIPIEKPTEGPCELCGGTRTPWVEGEFDDTDDLDDGIEFEPGIDL